MNGMMNKERYKQAFSNIHPSDEAIERIFDMTQKKTKRIKFKVLLTAAIVIALSVCAVFSANAATDGAVFEAAKLIINGENVNIVDYIKAYKSYTYNGVDYEEYEFEIPDGEGEEGALIHIVGEAPLPELGVDANLDSGDIVIEAVPTTAIVID